MKIRIDQIPESGLELAQSYEPSVLDLDRSDIKFTEPVKLRARVDKGINNISVDLQIDATMHLNCSKCLEEFTLPLSKQVNLNFPTNSKKSSAKEIDIIDNLREEIILSFPLRPLCRQDCLGLCINCGQNLNQGKCVCKQKQKV